MNEEKDTTEQEEEGQADLPNIKDPDQFEDIEQSFGTWENPIYTDSTRGIQSTLSYSSPNLTTSNFRVEKRSGIGTSASPFVWTEQTTGWTLYHSFTAPRYHQVDALPSTSVLAGIYRLTINEDSAGTNLPPSKINSSEFPVPVVNSFHRIFNSFFSNYTGGTTLVSVFTNSNDISGIDLADFAVVNDSGREQRTGWSIVFSNITSTTRTVTATPPANTHGTFGLRVKRGTLIYNPFPTNTVPSGPIDGGVVEIDNRLPPATAAWSNTRFHSGKLEGSLTFSGANVTNIEAADFTVLDSSDNEVTWTFDTPSQTATTGTGIIIRATPPANTNGTFKLRLKEESVRSGGSTTDNAPAANIDSNGIAVDNRPITATWGSITYTTATRVISSTITFNRTPSTIASTNFKVEKRSGAGSQTDPYIWTEQTTGWTIGITGSGTTRTVTATPASSVESGTYRITIEANAIASGQPSASASTSEREIGGESTLSGPSGYTANAISSYNNNIYVLWIRNSPRSYIIRKYSTSGVYDSTGDITITHPTTAPRSSIASGNLSTLSGLSFFESEGAIRIYICAIFANGTSVASYSLDGTFDSWRDTTYSMTGSNFNNHGHTFRTISIVNGVTYIAGSSGPIANPTSYWIRAWRSGQIATVSSSTSSSSAPRCITGTNYRRYLSQSGNNNLFASTIDPSSSQGISAENINAGRTFTDLTSIGNTVYGLSGSTLYQYTGLHEGEITEGSQLTFVNIPTDRRPQLIAASRNKVYVLNWRYISNVYNLYLTRYSLSGNTATYDANSSIRIPVPSSTSTATDLRSGQAAGITVYNNKLYLIFWYSGNANTFQLFRYSLTGTFEASLGWVGQSVNTDGRDSRGRRTRITYNYISRFQDFNGMQIFDGKLYIAGGGQRNDLEGRTNNIVEVVYVFPSITATGQITPESEIRKPYITHGASMLGVAVTYNRIYAYNRHNTLEAYNHSRVRQRQDDTAFNNLSTDFNQSEDRLYSFSPNRTPERPIYTFNIPQYASWAIPSVSATRIITVELSIAEDPGTQFATSDLKVEKRSGAGTSGDPYTWAEDTTGWAIIALGSGFTQSGFRWTRTIVATPPGTAGSGSYRVVLKEDAFGTNKPHADISTDEVRFANVATAAWSSTSFTNGKLQGSLTFSIAAGSNTSITGLTSDDFTVLDSSNNEVGNWVFDTIPATATAGTAITIAATPPSGTNASFKLRLKQESVRSDESPIDNSPAANVDFSDTVAVDSRPVISVTSFTRTSGTTNSASHVFSLVLSHIVPASQISNSDFQITDVARSNSLRPLSLSVAPTDGNQTTYTVTVNIPTNNTGTYRLVFNANSISESATTTYKTGPSANVATNPSEFSYHRPAIVATAAWSSVSFTNGKLQGTMTFSGADITDIATTDFEVINASGTVQTGWNFDSLDSSTATAGTGFSVKAAAPANANGTFRLRLKATSVRSDGVTINNSPGSAVISTGVVIDIRPSLSVRSFNPVSTSSSGSPLTGQTTTFNLIFSTSITSSELTTSDFTVTDITGSGVTVTNVSGTGAEYTVTATHPTNATGSYTIALDANTIPGATTYKIGPTTAFSTSATTYYNVPPIIVTAAWSAVSFADGKLQGTLTFSGANVTDIDDTDFAVVNTSGVEQTGWIFDTPPTTATAGTGIEIKVTPPLHLNGQFELRLKATSVRSDGSDIDNSPVDNVDSSATTAVDSRRAITATLTPPTNGTNNRILSTVIGVSLRFNHVVPASQLSNTDFTTTNGATIVNVVPSSGTQRNYTVTTMPASGTGSYTVSLNADSIADGTTYLEGPDSAISSGDIFYDTRTRIAVSEFSAPTNTAQSPLHDEKVDLTLNFDHDFDPTELTVSDFSLSAGSIESITPSTGDDENEYTIKIVQPANNSGTYTVTLAIDAIPRGTNYARGPASTTAVTVNYDTRDILSVTSFTLVDSGTQTGAETTLELLFPYSIPTSELDLTDFTTTAGTVKSVSGKTGTVSFGATTTYSVVITNPTAAQGSYTVRLRENAVSNGILYRGGPTATDPNRQITVTYDTRPQIAVNSFTAPIGTQSGTTSTLRLTLSAEVLKTELAIADFTATSGSVLSVSAVDTTATTTDNEYDVVITNPTNHRGSFTVSLAVNTISNGTTYKQGPATAYQSESVSYDTREAITASFTVPIGTEQTSTSRLVLTLGTAVPTGQITTSDFTVPSNISINSIAAQNIANGNSLTYWITVQNPTALSGTYTIDFKANSIAETDNYKSSPENIITSNTVTYDTRPGISANFTDLVDTQTGGTSSLILTINRTVPATEVTADDFSLSVTTASISSVSPTSGNASTYTIVINNPDNHRGTYVVTFAANAISAGTNYIQGPPLAETTTITYDTREAITGTLVAPSGTQRTTSTFILTLGTAVPTGQITDADFTVPSNTSINSINAQSVTTATTYHIVVNNPTTSEGSYTISFNANSIAETDNYKSSPSANIVSGNASYNTIPYTATWSGEIYSETTNKFSATISFSHDVDGLATTDFEILDTSDTVQSWIFDSIVTSVDQDSSLSISATVPDNTNGTFRIRLKEDSIQYNNLGTNNGPEDNTDSLGIDIDNRPQLVINSFTAPSGTIETATSTVRLTLNQSIPKDELEITDFSTTSGTLVSVTAVDTTAATNDDEYDIVITNPTNSSGSFTVTMDANSVDAATTYKSGPLATDPNRTSGTVNYDTREAITAQLSVTGGTQTGATSTITLTLNKSVPHDQISLSDFTSTRTLSNLSPITGSSTTFTLDASNPDNATGTYDVTFNMNSVDDSTTYKGGPASNVMIRITYDRRNAVTVTSFPDGGTASNRQTGSSTTLRLTLSHEVLVSEVTTTDFRIISGTGTAGTITSVGPVTNGATNDNEYNIVLANPTTARGDYMVAFRVDAVPDGTSYKEGPATAENATIYYDTRPVVSVQSFTAPQTTETGGTSTLTLTLDQSVLATEVTVGDFSLSITTASIASVNPTSGSSATYTIVVNNPDNHRGTYVVTFAANSVSDGTTYREGPAILETATVSYDTREVITASWTAIADTQTGLTTDLTLTFGNMNQVPSNQLTISEFTINNDNASISSISPTSGTSNIYTITVTNPVTGSGSYIVTFLANSVLGTDTYKTGPTAAIPITINYDTRPVITATLTAPATTQTGTTTSITLALNRSVPVSEVSSGDFRITGGPTITNADISPSIGSASTYIITVTNPTTSMGSYTITFNMNAISTGTTYKQGPTSDVPATINYDTRVELTVDSFTVQPGDLNDNQRTLTLILSSDVLKTQVTTDDFIVNTGTGTAGTISTVAAADTTSATMDNEYTITATNPTTGSGSYTVTFNSNSVDAGSSYKAGPSAASTSDAISYDRRPILTATFPSPSGTETGNTTTIRLGFSHSIPTSQVTADDFTLGDEISTIAINPINPSAGNARQYNIVITNPIADAGTYDITFESNTIAESTTYRSGPANDITATVTYDTRRAAIVQWGAIPSNTQTGSTTTLVLTVTNTQIPRGELLPSEFTTTAGTVTSVTGSSGLGDDNTFNVVITNPTSSSGSYTVTCNMNAISTTDTYLQGPVANVTTPTAISYDTRPIVNVQSFTTPSGEQTGATTDLTLTLDRNVLASEITASDFRSIGGATVTSISPTTGNEDSYTITITNPTGGSGSYTITFREDSIPDGTNYREGPPGDRSVTVRYDTRSRTVRTEWTNVRGGGTATVGISSARLTGTITFRAVTGSQIERLTSDDFEVLDAGNSDTPVNPPWNISFPARFPGIDPNQPENVVATPPGIINGMFKLRLKANSAKFRLDSDAALVDFPSVNEDSPARRVNRIRAMAPSITIATARWENVTGGATLSGRIYFDGARVDGIESGDFEVLTDSDGSTTGWTIENPSTSSVSDGQFSIITATPPANTDGNFKLKLNATSVMSDGSSSNNSPASALISDAFAVDSDFLDGENTYTLRINLPSNADGSLQISVNPRTFHIEDNRSRLGPPTQQYLGTIFYNNRPDTPRIININIPDRLSSDPSANTDNNAVIIDFNLPVKGVSVNAFKLEGMDNVTLMNEDIYYATTPDPDVPPSVENRNLAIIDSGGDLITTIEAKYYKLRLRVPERVPRGILKIYLADGIINNDP